MSMCKYMRHLNKIKEKKMHKIENLTKTTCFSSNARNIELILSLFILNICLLHEKMYKKCLSLHKYCLLYTSPSPRD